MNLMDEQDFCLLEDLEKYLFHQVTKRFHDKGSIGAFDFFCIIIWKAERAKTTIAENIKKVAKSNYLDEICRKITSGVFSEDSPAGKLMYLLEKWGFRLPTASAILTVLYPEEFTVYDVRVCETFREFENLKNITKTERIVSEYFRFLKSVAEYSGYPRNDMSLRDKDRYLWGKSFHDDLIKDINNGLPKRSKKKQ
jgi:hypothetical protein